MSAFLKTLSREKTKTCRSVEENIAKTFGKNLDPAYKELRTISKNQKTTSF